MTSESEENALRYRRAQSVTRAEEITEKEKKARKSQLDKPCHKPRDSLFTWSSEFTNFTGLVNWGFLMLFIGGVRLFLENILKYGFRVNPIEWIIVLTGYNEGEKYEYPSLILVIFSVVPIVIALLFEKIIALNLIAERIGLGLQISNILFVISLPVISLHFKGNTFSSVGMTMICLNYLVIFMKLWSYVQTNYWCRTGMKAKALKSSLRRQSLSAPNWNDLMNAEQEQSFEDDKNGDIAAARLAKYPHNLCLKDLAYFMLAPTLCYELNFPRTARIRKRFVLRRLLELVVGIHLILALLQQWMVPSITNSLETFSSMDVMRITERLLKLAVPNHLIWLCFFYLNFHSFLNLMGELLQFADRKFYGDWWNATNMQTFWSTWNHPVHAWALRHLYIPITDLGYSRTVAGLAVFFVSAFFHEYLEILRQLIAQSARIIEDKSNKTSANFQKNKEWKNITIKFNEILGKSRTDTEMKLAWKRIKLSAKANVSNHRREQCQTGGGEKPPSPSPEDLAIMDIAPHDFMVEVNDFDSDAVVSVPLQMFRIWAFLGMMAQPPLGIISRRVELELGPRWGNIIVWSSLVIGQPLCIMMYYHDYALLNFNN